MKPPTKFNAGNRNKELLWLVTSLLDEGWNDEAIEEYSKFLFVDTYKGDTSLYQHNIHTKQVIECYANRRKPFIGLDNLVQRMAETEGKLNRYNMKHLTFLFAYLTKNGYYTN